MPRHQTLFKEVKLQVKKIRKNPQVNKIVIGPYENCRHRYTPGTILIKGEISIGFKLFAYDGSGVVTLFLYLKNIRFREEFREYMKKFK